MQGVGPWESRIWSLVSKVQVNVSGHSCMEFRALRFRGSKA